MIENERKYVLSPKSYTGFMNDLIHAGHTSLKVCQGYLNDQTRIREIGDSLDPKYYFTYKQPINGKLIEIETEITKDDFKALWFKVDRVINKTRIVVPHDGYTWEIDFLVDIKTDEIFLVMAEVELPDGVEEPESIPDFISNNLLYLVPRHDPRFFNTRLFQPELVKKTVKDLKNGSKLHTS